MSHMVTECVAEHTQHDMSEINSTSHHLRLVTKPCIYTYVYIYIYIYIYTRVVTPVFDKEIIGIDCSSCLFNKSTLVLYLED